MSYISAPQRVNSSSCCRLALPAQRDLCAAATAAVAELPANWTRIARFMTIEQAKERVRERVRFQYRVCMHLFLTLLPAA